MTTSESSQLAQSEAGRSKAQPGRGTGTRSSAFAQRLRFEWRNRHFFVLDMLALAVSPALALSLRTDGLGWVGEYSDALVLYTAAAMLVKLPIFYAFGLYRRYWRHASVGDMAQVFWAVSLATALLTVINSLSHELLLRSGTAIFRTVPVLDGLLTGLVVGGARFGVQGLILWRARHVRRSRPAGRQVLIVGAGKAGVMTAREMQAYPALEMEPVAFVDDDPAKIGSHIHGIPVLGNTRDIARLVERLGIKRIVLAIPSAPLTQRRAILARCQAAGVVTYELPGVYELLAGYKTISRLPQIDINRVLKREAQLAFQPEVAASLGGTTVLVTGAGGSIGRELCRQIARFSPAKLILLGRGENSIHEINLDLRLTFPTLETCPVIVDVRDERRVDWVMATHRPDFIFHAAAHKHVPLMEASLDEAVLNNVVGTRNVVRAAVRCDARKLVLISTDKAVNPVSVMGVTKRLAELFVLGTAQRTGRAMMAVRFGNVLGSRGSVIPSFQQQIAAGGPVTVTHPDMLRYFMTIPEAVSLVLHASVLGQGGEAFVFDMGDPIRIADLASDLIRLSGLQPGRDIPIIYTGVRPGEKLHEELFLNSESYRRTTHARIFRATDNGLLHIECLEQDIDRLAQLARGMETAALLNQIRALVPEYRPASAAPVGSVELEPAAARLARYSRSTTR
jgi:FlaA1/EpsC-like NDP-sugar epimerase